ncbi:hypothetical protein [uncultured Olleya sp.]|uniref:hypothetical protein n=1 Tax=uncultured Olleya sp. TaxID=757243 RepID=UPI002598E31B|nr:hypothetical protein [uncultured Olleya sp.]
MIKPKLIFVILLIVSSCTSQSNESEVLEVITQSMIDAEEKRCVDKYEIEKIDTSIKKYLDTTNLEVVKKNSIKNLNYFLDDKNTIIEQLRFYREQENEDFKEITKTYTKEEEEYLEDKNTYLELVNDNHLKYRDTVQNGVFFNQIFKNNRASLKTVVRNNGATVFKFGNQQSIQPFYYLNFDSEKDLKILATYYHDGIKDSVPTPIEPYSFPLNSIPVKAMKHVDSLTLEFKIKYVSKIDSIQFNKNEIGVQKEGFKLLKMEKNYLEYETPNDYYPYHKGSILKVKYFNNNGDVLDNKYSISNCSIETPEEDYNERLSNSKNIEKHIKNVDSKKEAYLILKYLAIKRLNAEYAKTKKVKTTVEGNIDALTLYLENTRDTITFVTTLKNTSPVKNIYIHELEDQTQFIDKNGQIINTIPSPIYFLYSSKTDSHSDTYFFTDTDKVKDREYYFINQDKATVTKLPYDSLEFLYPSVIAAELATDNRSYKLLSAKTSQLLSDKTFDRFLEMYYTGKGMMAYANDEAFILYDQNEKLIDRESENVTKIILKKENY